MAELGSYIDNPQVNNKLCRIAAQVFGDCLRTKAGLDRKSTTTNLDMVNIYQSAKKVNSFTEENINKFEDRLMILLIRNYPYERRVKKSYELPSIIKEAADFDGFDLEKDHLPNFIQMTINGYQIQMLPIGMPGELTNSLQFNLIYDSHFDTWV